jgi:hypothetical protein
MMKKPILFGQSRQTGLETSMISGPFLILGLGMHSVKNVMEGLAP